VRAGMTKINISTHLNVLFTQALLEALHAPRPAEMYRLGSTGGREAVASEVERILRLLAND